MVLLAAAAIGFGLGASGAPDQQAADKARLEGFRAAFTASRTAAFGQAQRTGMAKGFSRGKLRAERAGKRRGEGTGAADAEAELERITQEEAEAAAQAEAEERTENCGAPLFVEGYCPTDEEIEQENRAESLCGPGDPALEEEAELYGIEC
ncbi:MAG: hypothetical protein M3Y75_04470 [Actinomycetota bacterium]|nr:hypothetical protein [Actinomycetota bacterium]